MVKTKSTYQHGKVSIIIPMFNRATLLPETLDAVLAQTYINWECILVDDDSTDNTLAVAKEYARKDSRFRVYSRPSNIRKGANGCRNYGFSISEGEFIQWFDSDDVMNSELINSCVSLFDSNIDLIVSKSKIFHNDIFSAQEVDFSYNEVSKFRIYQILIGKEMFLTSQVIIKRKFLQICKQLFNDSLDRNQETEFFIRLLLHDVKIKKNHNPLVYIRGHLNSISGKYTEANEIEKLRLNFPAYYQIYFSCKKYEVLNSQLTHMFNDFFYRCLRKKSVNKSLYCKLFVSGIQNKWFPSNFLASRIFLFRLIFNV